MSHPVTSERLGQGWYLLHLPPNPTGTRVVEVQHEGPDGMWRACPYGQPEREILRSGLRPIEELVTDMALGRRGWPESSV